LWRAGPAGRFGGAEAGFLNAIARPVIAASRTSRAGTFVQGASAELVPPGPVVLLQSHDLAVLAQTPEDTALPADARPAMLGQPPVPARAYNLAAQLLASEAGADPNAAFARASVARHVADAAGGPDRKCPGHRRNGTSPPSSRRRPPAERPCSARIRQERTRARAAPPPRLRKQHARCRPADVRARTHRAGPSQVDLRQDRRARPRQPPIARPRPQQLSTSQHRP